MKKILSTLALAAFSLLAAQAHATSAVCEKSADDKKLAGAARTAHMKKCDKDAMSAPTAACEKSAMDKKLAGAAKTSHLKKCMADTAAPAKT